MHVCLPVIEYDMDLQLAWPSPGNSLGGSDGARYRKMRDDFAAISAARPYLNHCTIACSVGAQVFGVTVQDLRTRPNRDVLATRQKIMAFAKVVTGANYHQIARTFNIDHSAVIRACDRYEDFIRRVLAERVG